MGIQYITLYRLLSKYNFPDFMKQATVDEIDVPPEGIPDHLYADTIYKRYPCHTKAATLISAAQYKEDKNNLPENLQQLIEKNLYLHASQQAIASEVAKILKTEEQLPDGPFAIKVANFGMFPIRNEREINVAAKYLLKYWKELSADLRKQAAINILAEAENKKYRLENKIEMEKFAGYGLVDNKKLANYVYRIARNFTSADLNDYELSSALDKIMTVLEKTGAADQQSLQKAVRLLSDLARYTSQIDRCPELETIISESEIKEAADDKLILKSGSIYDVRDIRHNLNIKKVVEVLPGIFEDETISTHDFCKIASGLNEDVALDLEDVLAQQRIFPIMRKPRAITIPGLD